MSCFLFCVCAVALLTLLAAARTEPEHGTCLMQLATGSVAKMDLKSAGDAAEAHPHILIATPVENLTAQENASAPAAAAAEENASASPAVSPARGSAATVPPSTPLAVRVQATAKEGSHSVVLGPAYKLAMELRLPIRMYDLHTGPYGPVRKFLGSLKQELCASGPLSPARLVVLDVRGEHKNYSIASLDLMEQDSVHLGPGAEGAGPTGGVPAAALDEQQETIVDMEVLPMAYPGDVDAAQVMAVWQKQLTDKKSSLRSGLVGNALVGATLVQLGPSVSADASVNEWGLVVRNGAQTPAQGLFLGVLLTMVFSF
mmetsp:Transcript_106489/g.339166  ORF Transcript_106489/g.339166 Transcript_106489/m.339166 type:complete len:315 (+) Transcript_106489:168-1112(+)